MTYHVIVGVCPDDPDRPARVLAARDHATQKAALWWIDINADTWRDALNPDERSLWAVVLRDEMTPVLSLDIPKDRAIEAAVHDGWATEQMLTASLNHRNKGVAE